MLLFEEEIPTVEITGKEIGEYTGDKKAFEKAFIDYYQKYLIGKYVTNPVLGKIWFYNSASKETISKNQIAIRNLKYIAAVKEVLKNSYCVKNEVIRHPKVNITKIWQVYGLVKLRKNKRKRLIKITVREYCEKNKKAEDRYYTFDASQILK